MKVIIPVAGTGTRLRPHTYTQPKALIPVAGKPILSFMLDELVANDVNEFVFIVGYLGDKIRDFIRERYPNIKAHFIEQQKREGVGHAVWLCKDLCQGEELLILLGDSVFDIDMKKLMEIEGSALGVKKVEDPRGFGVALTDENDNITKVIEKPSIPVSNLALIGLYKIRESDHLFDALEHNIAHNIRTRQAIQLTDALMSLIDNGIRFKAYKLNNWFDCGQKDSLLDTNTVLLKKRTPAPGDQLTFSNSIIIPPVAIGNQCTISNSIVGPNVTIAENSTIQDSIVRDSIIGSYSDIQNVMLHRSVIGSDANIVGHSQSLNIGDDAELDLRS